MPSEKTTTLKDRVEMRELLKHVAMRLGGELKSRPCLSTPGMAETVEQLFRNLHEAIDKLADDPTAGSLVDGTDACPVCDLDPRKCRRAGNCAVDPNPLHRPEPWEAMTMILPREMMRTIKEAVRRAREVCPPSRRSDSAALSLIAVEFLATHGFGFSTVSPEDVLRFLVETFEHAMELRIVVSNPNGELLYGINTLSRMAKYEGDPADCAEIGPDSSDQTVETNSSAETSRE